MVYLAVILGGEGDGGRVTGKRVAKQVTMAQDRVSTFVSVNSLDIFMETLEQFPNLYVVKKNRISLTNRISPVVFLVTKTGILC